jgi:hypothetical protein
MAILSYNTKKQEINQPSAEHFGPAHRTLVFRGTVVGLKESNRPRWIKFQIIILGYWYQSVNGISYGVAQSDPI